MMFRHNPRVLKAAIERRKELLASGGITDPFVALLWGLVKLIFLGLARLLWLPVGWWLSRRRKRLPDNPSPNDLI